MTEVVIVLAVLANGLQAGTYYTWASGVMPGLARTDDRTFANAMRAGTSTIALGCLAVAALGA